MPRGHIPWPQVLVTWPQGNQDWTHVGGRQVSQVSPGQQKLREALSGPEGVNLRQSLGVYSILIKHSSLGPLSWVCLGPNPLDPPQKGGGVPPAWALADSPTHPPTCKHFCFYLVIRKGEAARQVQPVGIGTARPSENETLPPPCQLHLERKTPGTWFAGPLDVDPQLWLPCSPFPSCDICLGHHSPHHWCHLNLNTEWLWCVASVARCSSSHWLGTSACTIRADMGWSGLEHRQGLAIQETSGTNILDNIRFRAQYSGELTLVGWPVPTGYPGDHSLPEGPPSGGKAADTREKVKYSGHIVFRVGGEGPQKLP
jgi:hypothetical protein